MAVKMLMKGAILPGNSTVEIKDFEIPKPGYGQVLIKTKATTICGSDIRCIYREHTGKGPEGYILGNGFRTIFVRTEGAKANGWDFLPCIKLPFGNLVLIHFFHGSLLILSR